MPASLAELANLETNPIVKGILEGIRMNSNPADLLPFVATGQNSVEGRRYDELPTIAWVGINGAIAEETIKAKPLVFGLYKMLHHIDIDSDIENVTNVLASFSSGQIRMAVRAAAFLFNNTFVNGDRALDPLGFDGINTLVENLGADQRVAPSSAIDIQLGATITADNVHDVLDFMDLASNAVEGNAPTVAFANKDFLQRLKSILRREDLLGADFDWRGPMTTVAVRPEGERSFTAMPDFVFNEVPYFAVGLQRDQSTQIIGNAFGDGDASPADQTRVFYCKLGPDDLEGYQKEGLGVVPIGMLEDTDALRWRLKWTTGLAMWGPRSVARLGGIRVA